MLFNTIDFGIFLPIVLLLYWTLFRGSIKLQNLFLIAVSYLFYSFWDWRFLSLIVFSSAVDFTVGHFMGKFESKKSRKWLLVFSLISNFGILFVFKYYNFFVDTFVETFQLFGSSFNHTSWQIILPVGISFYTFQTVSYTIDIYRNKIKPTKDIVSFFAFVAFFPQLVAGPIERAANLLPQFQKKRFFQKEKNTDGLRLILGGLFKKMVIADNCAIFVNSIFENYQDASGSTLFFGAVFFAFQIYGDFSGYSDIAIGSSRLLGFDLMKNFNFPYLAQNVGDFWRRWHISLSTWFRDYLYIPLGGNRVGKARFVFNIFVVFLVSGLWHGANKTFIVWGGIHALFILPVFFLKFKIDDTGNRVIPSWRQLYNIGSTFLLVVFAWIFFRAPSMTDALHYVSGLFSSSFFSKPNIPGTGAALLLLYMIVEWFQRNREHLMDIGFIKSKWLRYGIYYFVLFCIFYFAGEVQPFIYFQF
ncbi:MAG: MBOAT family protein [Flavobacteriaceae bacterium]|nr:MBOAT family protein [Flavobacteriaceae bacterium]